MVMLCGCFQHNYQNVVSNVKLLFSFLPGLSGKSQILFALVFSTRYLDLVLTFISVYNTVMKVVYLVCAYATVYLMLVKFKATYDSNHDTFRIEFLLIPVAGLACLVNHEFSVLEVGFYMVLIHIINPVDKTKFLVIPCSIFYCSCC